MKLHADPSEVWSGPGARADRDRSIGRDGRKLRVALVTEGNYPYSFGGVATWCNQLVQGLPEVEFELVTIMARRGNPLRWDLPPNVLGVTEVPFWEPKAPGEVARYIRAMGRGKVHAPTVQVIARLLGVLLEDDVEHEEFDDLLDMLTEAAKALRLAPAIRSTHSVDALAELWRQRGVVASLADVFSALNLIEHLLRTVSHPLPGADIYHSVSNGLAGIAAAAAAGRRNNVPVVLSEHGVYLRERYLEHLGGDLRPPVRRLLLRFHLLVAMAVYRRSDLVLPVTRYNRRWEVQAGIDPDRIRVIHNGVDPTHFPRVDERPAGRPPTLGFLGRIEPIKDPLTLIRAADVARRRIPGLKVRVWGDTDKHQAAYAAECRRVRRELGLDDVVSFEGRTDDVAGALAEIDVLVMSSVSEGLPYSVLEAMMSGVPIVSTDVGGIAEALADVGELVQPGDAQALGSACADLLEQAERRRSMAERARERALEDFTLTQMLRAYRNVYRDLESAIDLRRGIGTTEDERMGVRAS